jgi:hypothetical protein
MLKSSHRQCGPALQAGKDGADDAVKTLAQQLDTRLGTPESKGFRHFPAAATVVGANLSRFLQHAVSENPNTRELAQGPLKGHSPRQVMTEARALHKAGNVRAALSYWRVVVWKALDPDIAGETMTESSAKGTQLLGVISIRHQLCRGALAVCFWPVGWYPGGMAASFICVCVFSFEITQAT